MASVNISISDELLDRAESAELDISQLAGTAISDELSRISKLAQFDAYLAEMDAKLGPLDPQKEAEAEEWANRVLGPKLSAADAIVAALAAQEPDPVVLTSDPKDLMALAEHAKRPMAIDTV